MHGRLYLRPNQPINIYDFITLFRKIIKYNYINYKSSIQFRLESTNLPQPCKALPIFRELFLYFHEYPGYRNYAH